jgi:hypothetical protein
VSAKQFIFLVAWLSHPGTTIFDAYEATISISSHLSSLDVDLTKEECNASASRGYHKSGHHFYRYITGDREYWERVSNRG